MTRLIYHPTKGGVSDLGACKTSERSRKFSQKSAPKTNWEHPKFQFAKTQPKTE
jgi:hypothetical protein